MVLSACDGLVTKGPAVYLDAQGEPDIGTFLPSPRCYHSAYSPFYLGLRRGRPLFLNSERWEHLRQTVVQYELPSTVARSDAASLLLVASCSCVLLLVRALAHSYLFSMPGLRNQF